MVIGPVVALCLLARPPAWFAQSKPDAPATAVRISGRVVDTDGSPLIGYEVHVARMNSGQATFLPSVRTDSRGIFMFAADSGPAYRISLGPGVKTPPKMLDTGDAKDKDAGNMVREYCSNLGVVDARPLSTPPPLHGDLKPEQIIIEPRHVNVADVRLSTWTGIPSPLSTAPNGEGTNASVEFPQCWSGPSLDAREVWEGLCEVSFPQFVSLEDFVGGKVKAIRVTAYDDRNTPDQIKDEVLNAWFGHFHYVTCQIDWDEMTLWNVRAVVEFEDGAKGSLLTDGGHVRIQDREGKSWYLREWPAVD